MLKPLKKQKDCYIIGLNFASGVLKYINIILTDGIKKNH